MTKNKTKQRKQSKTNTNKITAKSKWGNTNTQKQIINHNNTKIKTNNKKHTNTYKQQKHTTKITHTQNIKTKNKKL